MSILPLPADLEALSIQRHDELLARDELIYTPSTPEHITHNGFRFQFRLTPAISAKPILPPNAPERSLPSGPFINPDPNFVITKVGPQHTLELSKYCVHRPSLVLHTNEFKLQTEDLDETDIIAAWSVLKAMDTKQIILYNCGVESGSSQGHKHLQLFPKPDEEEFEIFLDDVELSIEEPFSVPGVPYKHFALAIPENATAQEVTQQYFKLLKETKEALVESSANMAYNVLATKEWIVLIPRTKHQIGGVATNGVGMVGLVWVRDQDERDAWTEMGMTEHLSNLGIPN